jgi:uncharacterized protein YbbK (DUF523 family)
LEDKELVLVSACLLGINCRYNGNNKRDSRVLEWSKDKLVIPICPELFTGLGFPRLAAEIDKGDGFTVLAGKARVILKDGKDVTKLFLNGAKDCLKMIRMYEPGLATLKDRSPSCGVNYIYNQGKLVRGAGVFTALLIRENWTVISEKELWEK